MKKYIEIKCILDKSGSMSSIIADAINGINSYIKSQQDSGDNIKMSILLFADIFEKIYDRINVKEVGLFNDRNYIADGNSTSLYDAIGKTIDEHIDMLSQLKPSERPERTLFVIMTDGFENSSIEYNKELIKKMINEQREDFRSEFIFLAANQDACLTAESIGISRGNSFTYDYTGDGVTVAYANASSATTSYKASSTTKCDNLIH